MEYAENKKVIDGVILLSEFDHETLDSPNPPPDKLYIFAEDNGSGTTIVKTRDSAGAEVTLGGGGGVQTGEIAIAVSDETTALTTGEGKVTFRMPYAMTLTAIRASVTTAPTGSAILVDINENGSTILSTKLMINATEKTSTTAATPYVLSDTTLADDAEIRIDIDQIGSTIAGTGLKIWLIGTK